MEYLSSMYIDNEMDLEEKKEFVKKIRKDRTFYVQALELLEQEQLLRYKPAMRQPAPALRLRPSLRTWLAGLFRPVGFAVAGFCTALMLFFVAVPQPEPRLCNNRFVIFEPAAQQVALAGSFTGWERIAMKRVGSSGYWELNIQVPIGEHRFAYILDGNRRMADPTLPACEKDDFGGANSIINVEKRI